MYKRYFLGFLILLCLLLFACAGSSMTGTYIPIEGDSVADRIIFRRDGTFDLETFGMSFSGTYRIDGSSLTLTAQGANIRFTIVNNNTITSEEFGYEGTYRK